ncbi:MAG: hypothetical protein H6654_14950 [Ardenticatenaceae bacterium]|nr:hypothetical protein [Ardenticatenaceae bacterium]MCB8974854.1 hypothetical protein [Ardenticatenaceae bacterium]
MILLRIFLFLFGLSLAGYTFISAARTFVLPRSASVKLTSLVFHAVRKLFNMAMKALPTYEQRDSLMAIYAPLSLLLMVPTWLFISTVGFACMFWAMGITPWQEAFLLSGSSILTLGFATAETMPQTILAFIEATVGLILVAMLISYLPTMYSAFSQREESVSLLEVRAGAPPTAPELMWRLHGLNNDLAAQNFWESWELWFTQIDESHTSLSALVFFRSPRAQQNWVVAAGAVLDGAALYLSTIKQPDGAPLMPALVIRAGNVALRHIADTFQVAYNDDPHFPADPISVTRAEFDEAYDRLASQGVPLQPDRDGAWHHFAGWRVNYDSVLVALAKLTMAPEVAWLSDYTFVPAQTDAGQTSGRLQKVR